MVNNELLNRYFVLKKIMTEGNNFSSDRKNNILKMLNDLESKDLFTSPASTKYHCSYEGGLLEHLCNVAETALRLKKMLCNNEISDNEIVFVSFVHDFGKLGEYVMNPPTVKQQQYGYPGSIVYNTNRIWMDHSLRSIKVLQDYNIELTDEEYQAIMYHDNPHYGTQSEWRETKLLLILQYADYWSTRFNEITGEELCRMNK